jgi:hypothetical protein
MLPIMPGTACSPQLKNTTFAGISSMMLADVLFQICRKSADALFQIC